MRKITIRASQQKSRRPTRGDPVRDFMVPLELAANRLAMELRIPATRIGDIVHGRRSITADTTLRLARSFGTSAEFWMNLQTLYDIRMAQNAKLVAITRDVQPREMAHA